MRGNIGGLSTVGLCMRAGKLAVGFDAAVKEITNKKAAGIFLTRDVSEKTLKEIMFRAAKNNVKVTRLPYTMDDAEQILKKRAGVMAVSDKGLYNSVCKQIKAI